MRQKSSVLHESVREGLAIETGGAKQLTAVRSHPALRVRPMLLLGGIAAFLCLHAELAIIEHLDGHSLYMTSSEIGLDAGVTLLIMLGIAVAWWLGVLAAAGIARALPMTRRYHTALAWYLGLAVPFSYFTIDLFGAFKLWLLPSLQYPYWKFQRILIPASGSLGSTCGNGNP